MHILHSVVWLDFIYCCKCLREHRISSIHVQQRSLVLIQKHKFMAIELQTGADYNLTIHVSGLYGQSSISPYIPMAVKVAIYNMWTFWVTFCSRLRHLHYILCEEFPSSMAVTDSEFIS